MRDAFLVGFQPTLPTYKNSIKNQGVIGTLRNPPITQLQDDYLGLVKFDFPEDTAAIKLGIELWNTFNLDLTISDLINILPNYPGLNRIPLE